MHEWQSGLDHHFPVRYSAWFFCAEGFLLCAFTWVGFGVGGWWALLFLLGIALGFRSRARAGTRCCAITR